MSYKIIEFAIKNQRFFNSLSFLILIVGIFVYIRTPKDIFPEVKESTIQVQIIYPGASAERVQQQIVNLVESRVLGLTEIKSSSSISRKNVAISRFTVNRDYYRRLNEVRQLVQNTIESISFPEGVLPPQISSETLNDSPFIQLFIESDNKEQAYILSKQIEKELEYIDGMDRAAIYGREEYQYEINVNPNKIAREGIGLGEIYNAIDQSKTGAFGGGTILKNGEHHSISVSSIVDNKEHFENIVIRANEIGNLVLVKDIAEVSFDFADADAFYFLNSKRGIVFNIVKKSSGDMTELRKKLDILIEKYQASYPEVNISLFFDNSRRISDRIVLLNQNLTLGLIFVFLVLIFFFNFSTALWTTFGVPISFCVGLIMTVALGQNINTIVMISFLLILGVVVDDGIVFSENAYRHFEMGKTPHQAVVDGMGEVSMSVIFAALTTIASISTQFFLSGKIGDFAFPLPVVIICTLFGSIFESMFVLPGHLLHAFEHIDRTKKKPSLNIKILGYLQAKYEKMLRFLIYHRKKSLAGILILVSLLTGILLMRIPFVFYAGPPKNIFVFFDTPAGNTLEQTQLASESITGYLSGVKQLEDIFTITGFQNMPNKVMIQANVSSSVPPLFNWLNIKKDLKKYIERNELPLSNYRFNILGEDNFYIDKLEIAVRGTNKQSVTLLAKEVQSFLRDQKNIESPRLNTSEPLLNQEVIIDAGKAKVYGITPKEISQNIGMAFQGVVVGQINHTNSQYDVKLQYDKRYQTFESLQDMRIPNKFARFVSLSEMADLKDTLEETEIFTESGLYSIKVLDSLHETSILSNNSLALINKVKKHFAPYNNSNLDASLYFDNEISEVIQGVSDVSIALFIGIAVVLLILLYLFNSFVSSFLALAGIPFILFGLTLGLQIMNLPLNNMALLGLIALLGLVVNDAIVLLEHLYASLKRGDLFLNGLVKHVSTRFRPIIMTLTTTLVGVAPLAFGFSGNEFLLQPLAVVIFFGVLVVSLITLVILPLVISILEVDGKGLFFKYYRTSISIFMKHLWNQLRGMGKRLKIKEGKK
ncbi:MAG: efflux RND transporter permease subunit [Brevinema sp.]